MKSTLKKCNSQRERFNQYAKLSKLYELGDKYSDKMFIDKVIQLYDLEEDVITTDTLYYNPLTDKLEVLEFRGYCVADYDSHLMYPLLTIEGLVSNKDFIVCSYELVSAEDKYNIDYSNKYVNVILEPEEKEKIYSLCSDILDISKSSKYIRRVLSKHLSNKKMIDDLDNISDNTLVLK